MFFPFQPLSDSALLNFCHSSVPIRFDTFQLKPHGRRCLVAWCRIEEKGFQLRCCRSHLTEVQNCEVVTNFPLAQYFSNFQGHGSRVVKLSDRGRPYHEFESSTTKDPPCSEAMHVKSIESSNVLPLVWCGS
ncbi:hypothetical protein TNCV_2857441 [Trichonephila clavipes]|nr:hypothetical protein TNCV_2857441 [Trichonephila clavipes]